MQLTPREQQIITLLASGATNRQIAAALGIPTTAAIDAVQLLCRTLQVTDKAHIVSAWQQSQGGDEQAVGR